jgi:prepilin-type N-terminal cleavage/methylation domain-containing protein/prepilin-type processing-associated H-X9-DG protein
MLSNRKNAENVRVLPSGFTLVELLVVVGIIAILIAIIMPGLSAARQAARRTACAAKLQQIIVAAQVHAINHQGYYPLVGLMGGVVPADFKDPNASHYEYMYYTPMGVPNLIAPITMSLATVMGYPHAVDNATSDATQGQMETDNIGFIRHFICPSQGSTVTDLYQIPLLYELFPSGGGWCTYTEAQSYIFNEAILGYDDRFGRLQGRQSQIRQATKSMFCADGLGGSITNNRPSSFPAYSLGIPMSTVYNNVNTTPVTLADALTSRKVNGVTLAGDPQNFDRIRHHGKINIAFCDGHVETRNISSGDLASVYLLAP